MSINDLGFTDFFREYLVSHDLSDFVPGRILLEHRERYIVSAGDAEYEAEITGNLRFTATSREDFPAVGDWVAMKVYPGMAIIHHIFPRKTILKRQAVLKPGEAQIISANVDVAFIVQAVDINFNLNRLERYMTACHTSDIEPVLILSKTDLANENEISVMVNSVRARHPELKYILISNYTGEGLSGILEFMIKSKTYCFLGSSGVGKSTLINNLSGKEGLRTSDISNSTNKGRHTTEHRELIILENGAMVIDTPGMREFGITDDSTGVNITFREIHDLALKCRFNDCTHTAEKGCAVSEALEKGLIDRASVENYKRLLREQDHFTATVAEKRKKDKAFGKMAKEIMKEKKKSKF